MISPAMIALIAGAISSIGLFFTGLLVGEKLATIDAIGKASIEKDHIIVQQKVVIKEVPKIVTKVVTIVDTIEKEVESATKAADLLDPDCVMPRGYMELFVAAANGVDTQSPGAVNAFAGTYGCRESLKATLTDYGAGKRNSARFQGLEEWAQLVTSLEGVKP